MPFRPVTFEDLNQGTPKEKRRYYKGQMVVADLGSEHEARLNELRERSRELNRCLQAEFDAKDLPFSTKKDHDKVIRVNAQLRPQFLKTDLPDEEKAGQRFAGSSDEATFFLHLNDDNTYDSGRAICDSPYLSVILFDPLMNKRAAIEFDSALKTGDTKKLAIYLVNALAESYGAKKILGLLETKNIEDAKKTLAEFPPVLFRRKIAWNLMRSLLRNLFKEQISVAREQKQDQDQLRATTERLTADLLSANGHNLSLEATSGTTIKDALVLEMQAEEKKHNKPSPVSPETRINEMVKDLIKKTVREFKSKQQPG